MGCGPKTIDYIFVAVLTYDHSDLQIFLERYFTEMADEVRCC